jgi:protein-S-isoprenylcysteine O-methyltransferase Ste14
VPVLPVKLSQHFKGEAMSARSNEAIRLGAFQRRRRLALFLLVCAGFAGLAFVAPAWDPAAAATVMLVGSALVWLGILGRMWCTLYIGGRKSSEIVADGPYSMTRNPLYVFSAIAASGAGALSGSLLIAFGFGVATAIAFHVVIRREEGFLRDHFGSVYEDYCARVPRFFPDIRLFRDAGTVTAHPVRLYRTLGDGLFFFATWPVFMLIAALQEQGSIPVLLRLY